MDRNQFVALLQTVLQPKTDSVKNATATLKKDYYPNPESLLILLQLLTSHQDSGLRQLAATEARKLVHKHWKKIPSSTKPQIRQALLQGVFQEQTTIVRHAESRVIASIASLDLKDNEWTDLPGQLAQAALGDDEKQREVSTYILFSLIDTVGEDLLPKYNDLFQLFGKTIKDPQFSDVRQNSMQALGGMAQHLDEDSDESLIDTFQDLVPSLVAVLKQNIDDDEEDKVAMGFEIFQELLEGESRLISKNFKNLVQFMAKLMGETEVDDEIRQMAGSFLMTAIISKTLKFQAMRIGEPLITTLLQAIVSCEEEEDVREDDEEPEFRETCLTLINVMASYLPPGQVVGPLVPMFQKLSASSSPKERIAGLDAIAQTVEGAPEFLDSQLSTIMPGIIKSLEDGDAKVRASAIRCVKDLAAFLSSPMATYHDKIFSALQKNLSAAMTQLQTGDTTNLQSRIVVNTCTAFDSLADGVDSETLTEYLPELMPVLSQLFSHPDVKIKMASIGAVGTIAEFSGSGFLPYFTPTINAMSQYVSKKESEEELDLRALVCDALGNLAVAVGPEAFKDYVRPLMEATEEGLNLDHPRLRETSFMLWGTLAKVYGTDFKPFLPGVVKSLFEALEHEEDDLEVELGESATDLIGKEVVIGGKKVKVVSDGVQALNSKGDMVDADDEDDDEDSDDDDWDDIADFQAVAEEKETALEALAEVMVHTKREYLPYFEKSIGMVLPLVEHPYEATRRAAFSALFRGYGLLWQLQPEDKQKWTPGLPVQSQPTPEVYKFGELVMTAALEAWAGEEDKGVVLDLNHNVSETLKLTGPGLLTFPNAVEQVTQIVINVISKKHPCQAQDEDEEEDEEEEVSEDDAYLIETGLDVIGAFAKVLGAQFSELFKIFQKSLLSYASSSERTQRATAVGTLADIVKGMGEASSPYTSTLLKTFIHRLTDEDSQTKSNAAYGVGILVENSSSDKEIVKNYGSILTKLEPLLATQESNQLDNAAGCVARMISKHPEHIPLQEVLPALVNLLPLKEDWDENEPVYNMIIQLYQANNSVVQELTPKILPVIEQVLHSFTKATQEGDENKPLTDETAGKVVLLVKYIAEKNPSMVQSFTGLTPFL